MSGHGWLYYNHYNTALQDDSTDAESDAVKEEEKRRMAINPFLRGKQHQLEESQGPNIDEAVTGSAWMFYNQYNPELLSHIQKVLDGESVSDVVEEKPIEEKEEIKMQTAGFEQETIKTDTVEEEPAPVEESDVQPQPEPTEEVVPIDLDSDNDSEEIEEIDDIEEITDIENI